MSVFFRMGRPIVDAEPVAGYADAAAHLADRCAWAELALERGGCARRLRTAGATTAMALADAELLGLDARLAELERWIDARQARATVELPAVAVAQRLELNLGESRVVQLLVAVELDGTRLRWLGEPPALGLDLATLYTTLGWPHVGEAEWLGEVAGPLARGWGDGVIVAEEVPGVPVSRRPLTLSRPVLAALSGLEIVDDGIAAVRRALAPRSQVEATALRAPLAGDAVGVVLWIVGPGRGLDVAAGAATAAGREVAHVDVAALAHDLGARARGATIAALHLQQRLDRAVHVLWFPGPATADTLRAARRLVADAPGPYVMVSLEESPELALVAGGAVRYTFPRLSASERRSTWERELAEAGHRLDEAAVAKLAGDFPLTGAEIADVVRAVSRGAEPMSIDGVRAVAMARQRARLGRLAQFVPPSFAWEDLVLPTEERERLRQIVARQTYREQVLTTWNMASKLPYGTGTAALFSGPPGTGKTMAGAVMAREIGRELYRVDLSRIVDKYLGETEKNLGAIFDAAVDANAILLFDEADSLFSKRTQVQSSHDRYANMETNYLLQRIEEHPGISILTTNNVASIDEAFARRIQFRVDFPFPDEAARAEIWRRSFAAEVPRTPDVDYAALGRDFALAGGHIKSAVVRATFLAAASARPVSMALLRAAVEQEFENSGKLAPLRSSR